ncbi:hypothetical protein [Richelia intracellularis]|jgi:hypothetical protein|uniref:hypothetical protein n=1 Tax=Richelia intracellularis TaxID=1164990 RepID=UPI000345336D|nr:hypothetical protein [Richelia intracellularis]
MTEKEILFQKIEYFEKITSEWDQSKQDIVSDLKKTLLLLCKYALINDEQDIISKLLVSPTSIDVEYVTQSFLLDNKFREVQRSPLLQRLQEVIYKIRPYVEEYHDSIELLSFKPPDTLEIGLVNKANRKSHRNANFISKIEQSIQYYCPEITKIIIVQ